MLAADLIRVVEQAGGHLEPDGDGLVVEAPEPLPESIMAELRAHKAEVLVALAGKSARPSSGNDDLLRRAHLAVVPDLSDPEDIQAWLIERAAMREVGSGTTKVDANKLVFDELLWIWHAANPVTLAPGQCAACGTAFEPPVMSLPDGAQVCDQSDHACLIAYGNSRRMEAAKALAARSIHIEMRRMAPAESVEPVRLERLDFTEQVAAVARWAQDHDLALRDAEPDMPGSLFGRRADNWRHLIAIADLAGGSWPARARRAAETLTAQGSEQTTGILLLEDIKVIFAEKAEDKITSSALVERLVDIETRPWGEWSRGKPITVRQVARLLAPFGPRVCYLLAGVLPLRPKAQERFRSWFRQPPFIQPTLYHGLRKAAWHYIWKIGPSRRRRLYMVVNPNGHSEKRPI